MNVITKTIQLADGRTITIETGKVAKQTDGAVMLKMNNTVHSIHIQKYQVHLKPQDF